MIHFIVGSTFADRPRPFTLRKLYSTAERRRRDVEIGRPKPVPPNLFCSITKSLFYHCARLVLATRIPSPETLATRIPNAVRDHRGKAVYVKSARPVGRFQKPPRPTVTKSGDPPLSDIGDEPECGSLLPSAVRSLTSDP